ncbi:MAG: hypothetical protein ACRDHD_08245 [Candidatus Limnocylindria bacterium]
MTRRSGQSRRAITALAPLGLAALAFGLWWVSDRLVQVGPLDRAAFGWLVVVPVWAATPVVAALAWRRLTAAALGAAALVLAWTVGIAAAVLFWLGVADSSCDFGAVRAPIDWVLPSAVVGMVIGGGLALGGLAASILARRGHGWWAVATGAGSAVAVLFLAVLVATSFIVTGGCQRPPI